MANIALTTYCNLHCPYCFADTMINTENQKNISLDQLKKILDWIGEDNEKIGLIGGEPTLHPQFGEILEILKEFTNKYEGRPHYVLFTNAVYLDKYIQLLPNNLDILVNVNQPQAMTTEQYARMIKNIVTMYNMGWMNTNDHVGRVTIGCNICQQITNYQFIWDIVKRFNLHEIRMSVVAPTKPEQLADKDGYYKLMKPIFMEFVANAKKLRVHLRPDCNQIPPCYFTQEEINWIEPILGETERMEYPNCQPVIDITPDFQASSCFGAYKLIDCSLFKNLREMERYINYKVMFPCVLANKTGPCENCEKHDLMICQGGCLAFAKGQKKAL